MLATIKQEGKFGAINLRGEIVVPCKYILEEAMISVPISNKVYRQKQEEVKNAKGNGDLMICLIKSLNVAERSMKN